MLFYCLDRAYLGNALQTAEQVEPLLPDLGKCVGHSLEKVRDPVQRILGQGPHIWSRGSQRTLTQAQIGSQDGQVWFPPPATIRRLGCELATGYRGNPVACYGDPGAGTQQPCVAGMQFTGIHRLPSGHTMPTAFRGG